MAGGLLGFKARNHPQQIAVNGAVEQVDDRGTPPELFDPLHARFLFTLDVAAAVHNAKCARYFTVEDDGLTQPWGGRRVWCNPPYSDLNAWVMKAWAEWKSDYPPQLIVMLVPANRPEQDWWQYHIEPYRDWPDSPLTVEFIHGRQRFIRHWLGHDEVKPNERPPFGVCLLIWST
jgi:phage N-6-adenine-methyltransferase